VLLAGLAGFWASNPPVPVPAVQARQQPAARAAVNKVALVDQVYQEIDFKGFDDPKTTLAEALEELMKTHKVGIEINEMAFRYEMVNDVIRTEIANPNPVTPRKARLGRVLNAILARVPVPSGATWLLRRDHIEITTRRFAVMEIYQGRGREVLLRGEDEPEETYDGPQPPLVHLDLNRQPLAEALDALADRADWNIVLDTEAARGKEKTPITGRFRNTPLDTAVRLAASSAGLTVVEVDNVLFVTAREKVATLRAEHARARTRVRQRDLEGPPFADR
jgi:hypothetical protein